jgi:hypothetical protein
MKMLLCVLLLLCSTQTFAFHPDVVEDFTCHKCNSTQFCSTGSIFSCPQYSTALDFAYHILHCICDDGYLRVAPETCSILCQGLCLCPVCPCTGVSVCVSVSVSMSVCVSVCMSVSMSVYVCVSVSVSLSPLSLSRSLPLCLSVCFCVSDSASLPVPVSISVCVCA